MSVLLLNEFALTLFKNKLFLNLHQLVLRSWYKQKNHEKNFDSFKSCYRPFFLRRTTKHC